MNINPVGWFEIYVQDSDRAKQFYEGVFKVKLETLAAGGVEMFGFPMSASKGASGALVKAAGVASGGSGTLVYFTCEDCADEASRVEQFGGRIKREKMPIGKYGFVVLAYDTEGNLIGLHSSR